MVLTFKYLLLIRIIDENFDLKPHFEHVRKKVCVNVGMIFKMRRLITPHVLKLLINAYVSSVTDYCLVVWIRRG